MRGVTRVEFSVEGDAAQEIVEGLHRFTRIVEASGVRRDRPEQRADATSQA